MKRKARNDEHRIQEAGWRDGREPYNEMSVIAKGLVWLPFVLDGEFMGTYYITKQTTKLKQTLYGVIKK